MLGSFGFFIIRSWTQLLALTAGFRTSVTIGTFKNLQYKKFKAIKNLYQLLSQIIDFGLIILTAFKGNLWPILWPPWWLLGSGNQGEEL